MSELLNVIQNASPALAAAIIGLGIFAVVAGLGIIVASFVGHAILYGIEDVCKDKDNEEDSRTAGKDWHQDSDLFLN